MAAMERMKEKSIVEQIAMPPGKDPLSLIETNSLMNM
jgi:hypothetical protein